MNIGIFDSGFGGLTILKGILKKLPQYDYIYLGDNARVPYGSRSPQTTYEFTEQAVNYLMKRGCALVIIACNTASAVALRKLQRNWLPKKYPKNRILGVIRPTAEAVIENLLKNNLNAIREIRWSSVPIRDYKIGILATESTVKSKAFEKEIKKISTNNHLKIYQQSAPLLVSIVESGEQNWVGTNLILKKYLDPLFSNKIDILILGCTHYPIIKKIIKKILDKQRKKIILLSEDEIVPAKLADYLKRHTEIEKRLSKNRRRIYLTTDLNQRVKFLSNLFLGKKIKAKLVRLP